INFIINSNLEKNKKQIMTNQKVNQLLIINEPLTPDTGKMKYVYFLLGMITLDMLIIRYFLKKQLS
ncbi:MAG: hypothetical protein ABIR66_12245, partial [Saprospiraceae bacterium]